MHANFYFICINHFNEYCYIDEINSKKIKWYKCGKQEDIKGVNDFFNYIRQLPESDKHFNDNHAINVKGLEIEWQYDFPIISGKCNKCQTTVTGLNNGNQFCKNAK